MYDAQIWQTLTDILQAINRVETILNSIAEMWFPILLGMILLVVAILILKWLVKL